MTTPSTAPLQNEDSEPNLNMFFVTLAIAGHETTRGTASHFIRLMNEHPRQYELLHSDLPRYLPNAIREVLRFSPPVIKFRRTATEDTEIGGCKVSKGDKTYIPTLPRTAIRQFSTDRTSSTSPGRTPPSTCRSASARISGSGRGWPGCSFRRC